MISILEKISNGYKLIADGAMGSLLMQKGLKQGDCPEALNLTNKKIVSEVAEEYFAAGADLIQTNSFGGSVIKLDDYDLGKKTEEINREAAKIVKDVVGDSAYVSGSCGPTGKMLEPFGNVTRDEMFEAFKRQVSGLIEGGADIICVETMTDLVEAQTAIEAVKLLDKKIPIMCTMTFNKTGDEFFTMMGTSIEAAVKGLSEAGADIIGSNCGNGVDNMLQIAAKIKSFTNKPIIIQSNAGLPELKDGKLFYPETPEYFASKAQEMFQIGVSIVGGCCGTTPEYISAIKKFVEELNSNK